MRVCAVKGTNSALGSCASSRPRMPSCCLASTTMERPSGVSSARLESCAASASSCGVTPGAGMNSTACRLPSVMVPVLSSRSTSTSPAASTARPLMASTFFCTSRSMPAMPMALSSPPMVVGIRHTSSAMSTVGEKSTPENLPKGSSVMHTSRKMIVNAESRIVSAISLGVFCRFAPSTRPIMRSRKLSPGLAEMRTLISSREHARAARDAGAVAARLADDRRALAGDGALVHGGRALDDLAVAGDGFPGDDEHHVALAELVGGHLFGLAVVAEAVGGGLGAAGAQGVGLRFAAAFGHGLGEVGEEHGEPQPHG